MNNKTSADVYRTAYNDRQRYKQDKAERGWLDSTFLHHFSHNLVTNQLKVTPRGINRKANEGREKVATITGRLPPTGVENEYEKKGLGFPDRSTKVPETTPKDASVTVGIHFPILTCQ